MTLMISNVSSMARTARPSIERFRLPAAHLLAGLMLSGVAAQAQTSAPLVLPNTLSTVAGSSKQIPSSAAIVASNRTRRDQ